MTKIEWTDATWNPIVGCSKVSNGCKNCYALPMAWRLQNNPNIDDIYHDAVKRDGGKTAWTGVINFNGEALLKPLKWKKTRKIFVNSMSDLFHENVPDEWIDRVFAVMALCPQHIFQILTKRPERMRAYYQDPARDDKITWSQAEFTKRFQSQSSALSNVWIGVSVEDQKTADERIPILLKTPAALRWVSAEPLLGPIEFGSVDMHGVAKVYREKIINHLDWVVVGGESGHGARPMHPDWVRGIQRQCEEANVPFLFKQWGEWEDQSNKEKCSSEILCHTQDMNVLGAGCKYGGMLDPDWREKGGAIMGKVGKKAAGRLLDGVEYDQYPIQD